MNRNDVNFRVYICTIRDRLRNLSNRASTTLCSNVLYVLHTDQQIQAALFIFIFKNEPKWRKCACIYMCRIRCVWRIDTMSRCSATVYVRTWCMYVRMYVCMCLWVYDEWMCVVMQYIYIYIVSHTHSSLSIHHITYIKLFIYIYVWYIIDEIDIYISQPKLVRGYLSIWRLAVDTSYPHKTVSSTTRFFLIVYIHIHTHTLYIV